MTLALREIERVLAESDDADEALRETVRILAAEPGVVWAGIAFAEDGELILGPQAGTADPTRRIAVPVVWEGATVGEVRVDGETDEDALTRVAALVSSHVLLGWDTGGETWEP